MKLTRFCPIVFVLLLSTLSCSNDFDVTAGWKDIPIVYGLLNIADTAHYVRLEKAFLDPSANALELAKIPDSLYYQNARVRLIRESNNKTFELKKVDGNLEGYKREDGVFSNAPNWLYKIDSAVLQLKEGEKIRLEIERGNNLPLVTASTTILPHLRLISPSQQGGGSFRFDYRTNTRLIWRASKDARIFDVKLVFRYAEYEIANPSNVQRKSVEWLWARGVRNEENQMDLSLEKNGREFYEVVKNNIPVNSKLKRIFEGIDVEIIAGGEALEKFVNVALANTGITSSQELPHYTNLSEGRGVFSSIQRIYVERLQLNASSLDSLRKGTITGDLNF